MLYVIAIYMKSLFRWIVKRNVSDNSNNSRGI